MSGRGETGGFCTGVGQFDTHGAVLSNGRENPNPLAGAPYSTITAREIVQIVKEPPSVPKDDARWFIPSTYAACDARDFGRQRAEGVFWWLVVDIDEGGPSLDKVRDTVHDVIGDAGHLIYSSRSATVELPKWRVLIPLQDSLSGEDYGDTAEALFDLLEGRGLRCDYGVARAAQLIYLPNRGAFYEHAIVRGPRLALDASHPIISRREAMRTARRDAASEARPVQGRRAVGPANGTGFNDASPVDHFNALHSVEDLLGRYGYAQCSVRKSLRSPMQTSGSYATCCNGDYWTSLSASDAEAGIGRQAKDGQCRFGQGSTIDLTQPPLP